MLLARPSPLQAVPRPRSGLAGTGRRLPPRIIARARQDGDEIDGGGDSDRGVSARDTDTFARGAAAAAAAAITRPGRRAPPAAPAPTGAPAAARCSGPQAGSGPPARPPAAAAAPGPATAAVAAAAAARAADPSRVVGFAAELAPGHPGFHDAGYKARRAAIARAAREHAPGEPAPRVAYTREEDQLWASAHSRLTARYPALACRAYNRSLPRLGLPPDRVPQLADVSARLTDATGFALAPVAGLLAPIEFLRGLAGRVFFSTQYVRHASRPEYTPEPDVVHEILGHAPLLAYEPFAAAVQAIGRAASAAPGDPELRHLVRLYWFAAEYSVVRERPYARARYGEPAGRYADAGAGVGGGSGSAAPRAYAQRRPRHVLHSPQVADGPARGGPAATRALGAGILSSFGELDHMAAGRAALRPLRPAEGKPKMDYKDGFQAYYYVAADEAAGTADALHFDAESRSFGAASAASRPAHAQAPGSRPQAGAGAGPAGDSEFEGPMDGAGPDAIELARDLEEGLERLRAYADGLAGGWAAAGAAAAGAAGVQP